MAMRLFLLFTIFFYFNNAECSLPEQDSRIISKTSRDKRFSEINTATNNPHKIYRRRLDNREDSSDESVTNSYEEDGPEEPLDHQIPYSEHEVPRDVSTHTNYTAPGVWAKPPPDRNIPLEFVPTKLYAQVRASHTIKRVPQEEAIEAAETREEKENAARLREVVTNSKKATVYTEEGYEDSAYDHAGHARGADYHEGYARKLDNELDRGTQGKVAGNEKVHVRLRMPKFKYTDDHFDDYRDDSVTIEELESRKEGKLANFSGTSKLNNNAGTIFKEELENPEINPKVVVEEGIDKLKSDNKYENEEAERGSENYTAEKLVKLKDDYNSDEANSFTQPTLGSSNITQKPEISNGETKEQSQLEERTEPVVYTVRPRNKFYIPTRKAKKNSEPSRKNGEHKKRLKTAPKSNQNIPRVTERYDETAYLKPDFYVNNPTEDEKVVTLGYTPLTEVPTTINYGEIFWKYFKERQNQRAALQPRIFHEGTTVPDSITMSSINGHGPYLVVTNNQKSALGNLIAPELINNLAHDPVPEVTNLQWPDQSVQKTENNENLDGIVSNTLYPDITDATIKSWSLDNDEHNSEVFLGTFKPSSWKEASEYSSTPYSASSTMLNDFPSQQKNTHYDHNPFLIHYARSAKANIPRYTVIVRTQADRNRKGDSKSDEHSEQTKVQTTTSISSNNQQDQYPIIPPIQNKNKMLHDLRNQGNFRPINQLNTRSTQDFSFLRPPPLPSLSSSLSSSLPHPSTVTRQIMRLEKNGIRFPDNQIENPVRVTRAKLFKNPPMSGKGNDMFLMLHLHPPDPSNKSEYAEYRIRNRRSGKFVKSKKTIPRPFPIFRNNFPSKWKQTSSVKKRIKRNITNMKEVELLNESPRITDEVIDNEIKKRFENTGNHANETSEKSLNNEVESVEIEIPEFDYVNEFNDDNFSNSSTTPRAVVDLEKYPFYENDTIPSSLTLKYIINPERIPRKTFGGMEFYESRNYLACDDVNPNLENVAPAEEKPVENRDLKTDLPRLQGLGEKLDCYKAKYFDNNPLDNPLFQEAQVEQPMLPVELNKTKFSSRILVLPSDINDYYSLPISKNPRKVNRIRKDHFNTQKSQINNRLPKISNRRYYGINEGNLYATTPYQTEVYEDVMGNIQNVEHMSDNLRYKSFPSTTFKTNSLPVTTFPTVVSTTKITHVKLLNPAEHSQNFMKYAGNSLRQKVAGTDDRPYNLYPPIIITGLVPPPQRTRIMGTPYKSQIAYKMKLRDHPQMKSNGEMILGYYRLQQPRSRNTPSTHFPKVVVQKKVKRSIPDSYLKLLPSNSSKVLNETEKVVYTINDRIRHSKPKREYGKHGRFTTEPTPSEVDSRRLEPRYNPLKRRRGSSTSQLSIKLPETTPTTQLQTTTVLPSSSTNSTIPFDRKGNPINKESISEQKTEATFKLDIPLQSKRSVHSETTETSVEDQEKFENTFRDNDEPVNKYDVYEDTSEEKPLAQDKDSSESREHTEKEDDVEERENSEDDGSSENSEESVEEAALEAQDEKENADQISVKGKDINEEDRTFERFDSRPYSPPENFEDEKYADLGPRIHKPLFYHPPFDIPKYERSHLGRVIDRFDSKESEESGDVEKYTFPWEKDENGSKEELQEEEEEKEEEEKEEEEESVESGEESQHFTRVYGGYVYPWEKRDRVAKEKRNKKRDKFDLQHASSDKKESYAYPWDRDDIPSKSYEDANPDFWPFDTSFNNQSSTTSVSDKVSISLATPSSQEVIQNPVHVKQMKLSTTPVTRTTTHKSTSHLNTVSELTRKTPKRKQKDKSARISLNKTAINSDSGSKKKLRQNRGNPDKLASQPKTVTVNTSTSSTMVDPASRAIRKRSSTKRNFRISKIDSLDSKQTNTTARNNRRRGSTTISPEVSVLTRTTSFHRRSPFIKSVAGDKKIEKNVSKKDTASTRPGLPRDDDFDIPTPASRTIEHRSRVSKEEIITKTVYPSDRDTVFDSKEMRVPIKRMKINKRKRLKDGPRKNHPVDENEEKSESVLVKETPNHVHQTEGINKDGIKEINIVVTENTETNKPSSYKPQLVVTKPGTEEKIDENRLNFDDIQRDGDNEAAKVGSNLTSDIYVVENLMKIVPLQHRDGEGRSKDGSTTYDPNFENRHPDEYETEEESKEIKPHVKFINDPSKRLYYYIDDPE